MFLRIFGIVHQLKHSTDRTQKDSLPEDIMKYVDNDT